ncbi:DUF4383 domain-containing protein [Micromonospora sp. NPDC000207]|uniref:DUF4383 domain-containing protein n=1 Tax=Micromonospora sp. NPDC000207 TaxID=3154246 RepID=UPI00332E8DB2
MTGSTAREPGRGQPPLRRVAQAVGVVFLLVGLLGFVPGVTTDIGALRFAGHESDARLLGVFQVSVLHNLVHLLFGVAGLLLARTTSGARTFLVGGGAIYLVLWVYGLVVDHGSTANFIPVNTADNWLHLGLGVGMVLLGLLVRGAAPRHRARGGRQG